ncbi:hypothetical protein GCM10010174_14520 [Kutzneria viridogrisea]|uniref:Antitoxin FitA-like ribbon-helix-helix domain-containing protein n=2 Tax=Kutzneria TaxID=43356 RepID=W5WJ68_9PSEU|nr:antitoxin [Kutzneria albida]AHI00923.1 hypothetical protein KALB_7565 [Kutzneria albida DSM 43870]MBA8926200.1 plasmid stability protein [Kutzneria viridogrisea]
MATIQVRDIPEDAYETLRKRARAAGQSIQAYMRDQIIALASQRTKEEVVAAIDMTLLNEGTAITMDSIVTDLAADRR